MSSSFDKYKGFKCSLRENLYFWLLVKKYHLIYFIMCRERIFIITELQGLSILLAVVLRLGGTEKRLRSVRRK